MLQVAHFLLPSILIRQSILVAIVQVIDLPLQCHNFCDDVSVQPLLPLVLIRGVDLLRVEFCIKFVLLRDELLLQVTFNSHLSLQLNGVRRQIL